MTDIPFEDILQQVRNCRHCEHFLPLGPRPIVHGTPQARLLIISQAPGTKAHLTGQSFNDASGDRLRQWLGIGRDLFYNPDKIAIMPMGLCYPGRLPKGGDCPPVASCSPRWHPVIRPLLKNIQLTLLVGGYAQRYYLGKAVQSTIYETVAGAQDYLPDFFPLPHPSWRTTNWAKIYPWFETETIPSLQYLIQKIVLS